MIYFCCKKCKEAMEAPESLSGEVLKCPTCSFDNTVPQVSKPTGTNRWIATALLIFGLFAGGAVGYYSRNSEIQNLQSLLNIANEDTRKALLATQVLSGSQSENSQKTYTPFDGKRVDEGKRGILKIKTATGIVDLSELSMDDTVKMLHNGTLTMFDIGWTPLESKDPVYMSYNEFKNYVVTHGGKIKAGTIANKLSFDLPDGSEVFTWWSCDNGLGLTLQSLGIMYYKKGVDSAWDEMLKFFPSEYIDYWVESDRRLLDIINNRQTSNYAHQSVRYTESSSYFFRHDRTGAKFWIEYDPSLALECH